MIDAQDAPATSAVEFGEDGRIKGWLSWPADPIYRPVIGAFAGEALIETAATERRPAPASSERSWLSRMTGAVTDRRSAGTSTDWRCFFSFALTAEQAKLAGDRLTLQCLETGQILSPKPEIVKTTFSLRRDKFGVSDLITLGSYSKKHPDVSGFLTFLSMDPSDQLELLYTSLLRRRLDPGGLEAYLPVLYREEQTILDVRDAMLLSEEFKSQGYTINDRIGGWLVWSGLEQIRDAALPMSLTASGIDAMMLEQGYIGEGHLGAHLARLALRQAADGPLVQIWTVQHAEPVALVREAIEAVASKRRPKPHGAIRLQDLLAEMEPGAAGHRHGVRVKALAGDEGLVLRGPYLALPPGAYRLTMSFEMITQEGSESDNGAIARIDVGSTRAIFASSPVSAEEITFGTASLDFVVPVETKRQADLRRTEFRVWTSGLAQFEITGVAVESLNEASAELEQGTAIDWLTQMRVGSAGERTGDGTQHIRAERGKSGHVVFGPYVQLLPGDYELTISCLGTAGPSGGRAPVAVEVVAPPDRMIAKQLFELQQGHNEMVVTFEIDTTLFELSRAEGTEFRVHKRKESDLAVTGVRTIRRMRPGSRGANPKAPLK